MRRLIKVFKYIFYVNKFSSFDILKSAMKCGVVRELSSYLNIFPNIRHSLQHHPSCRSEDSCSGLSTGQL